MESNHPLERCKLPPEPLSDTATATFLNVLEGSRIPFGGAPPRYEMRAGREGPHVGVSHPTS